jgi:4-amino-4-deoxy-L-arabinose transferase-like glycosyltransferase
MTAYNPMNASSRRLRAHHVVLLALIAFSFALAALVSGAVFERLPHLEDELAYLFQAKVFARGDLVAHTETPANAFWQPFVIDYHTGARFSKYPPGWSALLAFGVMGGQPWLVNALFAALTVALTYRLGRDVFGRDAGLIAAALTAFSPMALLLNGTLMNHTAALFFTTLFLYAYWRLTRGRRALLWAAAAGAGLGMALIIRPLSALGVAAPFILWSLLRLALERRHLWRTFKPLLALSVVTLLISAAIPLFNYAATGDPLRNLYTLVPGWNYDRVGFGEGFGRNGHTLEKGVLHARYDLSLTAADLFGWQLGAFTPEPAAQYDTLVPDESRDCLRLDESQATLQQHLRTCSAYWPVMGVSWVLLLPGLLAVFRRDWAWLWVTAGVLWLVWLPAAHPQSTGLWLVAGGLWTLAPLVFVVPRAATEPRAVWAWLLFAVIVAVIGVHLAYWVGSQRYSTRYYFEALTAAALISALPLAWLLRAARRRVTRRLIYAGIGMLCLWSLLMYSLPRIGALYGYNRVTQQYVDAVNARRQTDRPVLVLVSGESARRWRSQGALMALTSPYLDSDLVTAWVDGPRFRELLLERFPDREIIEVSADGELAYFEDECDDTGCPAANHVAQPPPRIPR